MKRVLFGRDYKALLPSELIKATPKTALIHIYSAIRMKELFSLSGLSFGEAIMKQYKYSFCGKIILKDKNTDHFVTAYIIDESVNTILMISRGGKHIELRKPWYNDSNHKSLYGLHSEYTRYNLDIMENMYYDIIEYYPIRIYLNQGKKSNF